MKKFRILGLMAAAMLLAGATANAQERNANENNERPSAEQVAAKRTAHMTEALSLTEEQAKQVADLNLADAKRAEAHREANHASREKMKQILTPEQYAQWKQISREGAHRRGNGPQGSHHMNPQGHHKGHPGMASGEGHKGPHAGKPGCCKGNEGKPCCKKGHGGKPCDKKGERPEGAPAPEGK